MDKTKPQFKRFEISDGNGGIANDTIRVEVINVNRPPILDLVGDRIINETETLIISLNASDPDGDVLTYSCNRTDMFADFNPATGTGNWITDYDDSGIYWVDFNGHLYWYDNPRGDMADLNNDGIVDILDAVIVGTCWGHVAW